MNDEIGAWSGMTATSQGDVPTEIAVPAVCVATVMGVTVPLLISLHT